MKEKICKQQENMGHCSCSYEPCVRKGVCCECIKYHWKNRELPACFFPRDVEWTYDRSLERFIECYSKK
ncbi:MAG: hypothetical protein H5T41_00005 [Methanomassiliicoccales archaeon]|nr:hypothetical protein [Methanomassiliicoccales archaeon]